MENMKVHQNIYSCVKRSYLMVHIMFKKGNTKFGVFSNLYSLLEEFAVLSLTNLLLSRGQAMFTLLLWIG